MTSAILGYMAGVTGLTLGQELVLDCEINTEGPSSLFITQVYK